MKDERFRFKNRSARATRREKRNLRLFLFSNETTGRPPAFAFARQPLSLIKTKRDQTLLCSHLKISPTKGGGKNVKKTNLQSCLLQRDQSSSRAFAGFVHLPVRPLPDLFELFVALVDRGRVTHGLTSFSDTENRKDVCVIFMKRERDSCFLSIDGSQWFSKFFARKTQMKTEAQENAADFSLSFGNKKCQQPTSTNSKRHFERKWSE